MSHLPKFPSEKWDGLSANPSRTSRNDIIAPDGRDYRQIAEEVIALQERSFSAAGVSEAPDGVVATDVGGPVFATKFVLDNFRLPTDDNGASGAHGGVLLYTFPSTQIKLMGSFMFFAPGDIQAETGGGAGISDTATFDIGVGSVSVSADNGTLTATEDNLVPSDAVTLTGGASTTIAQNGATNIANITSNPVMIYLNAAMADAQHGTTSDALIVTGSIVVNWMNLRL